MVRRGVLLLLAMGPIVATLVACSSSGSSTSTATNEQRSTASSSSSAVPDPGRPGAAGSVPGATAGPGTFVLSSGAFEDGATIPIRYACTAQGGAAASPPLAWTGAPAAATTLVLVVHDPDAPIAGGFTHLVTSFPASTTAVADGENATATSPMARWIGPCPPSGTHHYSFTLYAFGPDVTVAAGADKTAIDALAPQALGKAQLTGLFSKQ